MLDPDFQKKARLNKLNLPIKRTDDDANSSNNLSGASGYNTARGNGSNDGTINSARLMLPPRSLKKSYHKK